MQAEGKNAGASRYLHLRLGLHVRLHRRCRLHLLQVGLESHSMRGRSLGPDGGGFACRWRCSTSATRVSLACDKEACTFERHFGSSKTPAERVSFPRQHLLGAQATRTRHGEAIEFQ